MEHATMDETTTSIHMKIVTNLNIWNEMWERIFKFCEPLTEFWKIRGRLFRHIPELDCVVSDPF